MAFLNEGAVKDLISRGPNKDDVVAWAEDFVLHDDIIPTPSIPDYIRGHGLTLPEFETLVNMHLGEAEDPHSEDVIMRLLVELEALHLKENSYQNKNTKMKESIKMPRLLKEDHSKECSDEVQMAKIQLKSIMADAGDILQNLDQCEDLDAWVQSKLAIADDHLTAIAKYMKYEEESPEKELPLIPEPEAMDLPPGGPDEAPDMDDLGLLSQPDAEDELIGGPQASDEPLSGIPGAGPEGEPEVEIDLFSQPETKNDVPEVDVEDELSVEDVEESGLGIMESEIRMPRLGSRI